ncbi:hypothetical protein Elgi_55050 [Paenibacillus elgii]|uniref:hypothetical protein n=1 Tax=Paenibacillus elgii TaxID=189691 RepID=UPI002D7BE78C|nr:hypothetical protein Elgi_55050 [Paenibacillus elgii]
MKPNYKDIKILEEIEIKLTRSLKAMQHSVLAKADKILKEKYRHHQYYQEYETSIHSLHGIIGSKNNTYVDSIRTQFVDPNDFIARWLQGLMENEEKRKNESRRYIVSNDISLLQDEEIREYTFLFLERNFYRNLMARTRVKPQDSLWKVWFGGGKFIWGLLIAPAFRNGSWTNDVSEIRRANYKYWTIGHVMSTGIIDPTVSKPMKFSNVDNLMDFYRSVLKRVSNSQYEQAIFDNYLKYIEKSKRVYDEPLLIPELRYAGLENNHQYRLDFTILNPHSMKYVGYELSPHSTHMAISGITQKTQVELNRELSSKWNKEMTKRNEYFSSFGITTITFTDEQLSDIDNCFKQIEITLKERINEKPNLNSQLETFKRIYCE